MRAGGAKGGVMQSESSKRELVVGTGLALVLSVVLSWIAVHGLNRYLGPIDDSTQTTGSFSHPPAN
jgi:hypothetical protein